MAGVPANYLKKGADTVLSPNGGLLENIPGVLPDGMAAHLVKGSYPPTGLFAWLQKTPGDDAIAMLRDAGETVYEIGVIAARGEGASVTVG